MRNETEKKRKWEFVENGWEREARVKFDVSLRGNSSVNPG